MDKFPKGIVLAGGLIIGLTVAMGWGGVNMIIRGQVKKEIRIINKTDTYRAWKDFPLPLYLSIYLFNITNPEEVAGGGKPIVQELGPYVYMEQLHKTDLEQNYTTEIVTFRQLRFYFFQPDMSTGTEEDIINIPNIPLIGLANVAHGWPTKERGEELLKGLDEFVSNKEESLIKTGTVHQLLFEGIPVGHYASLVKESNGDPELDEFIPFVLPNSFSGEKYGLFRHRNGTGWDGLFDIHPGRNFSWLFGEVLALDGEPETTWWQGECNIIQGSDGLSFHPFINQSSPLITFEPPYCRSHFYAYESSSTIQEVTSFRFTLVPQTFQGVKENPSNWCYCSDNSSKSCERNGVYDLAPCYEGFPFLLSRPHFLDADQEIKDGVEGLNPNQELHETFLEMHPMSGIPLKTAKRFQFNLEISPIPGFSATDAFKSPMIVPLFWYQESIEAGALHILVFKIIAWVQNGWDMLRYGFLGGGFAILLTGILLGMFRRNTDPDRMVLVK